MNKRALITFIAFILIAAGSWIAIRFAKGYRPNLSEKTIAATGLLVANSSPNGASVYLNDKLNTATNNTLNLPPGDYLVKIIKDGYLPWQKELIIKKELVTQANAELFKNAPDLQSLTSTGGINPVPSPDGTKIAFAIASASAERKNGLWVMDMGPRTISFSSNQKQIAANTAQYDFSQARFFWTPDSQQILAVFKNSRLLLEADKTNNPGTFQDVTLRLPLLINEWQEELTLIQHEQLAKLPEEMQYIATASAKLVFFNKEEEKMLYTATASATIKENLIPPLLATNTQPEEREIKPNRTYVYDLVEDKNFLIKEGDNSDIPNIPTGLPLALEELQQQYSPLFFNTVQWYPTGEHLVLLEQGKINILEYDGTNKVAVYNGPFEDSFVFPWPGGSRLVVLSNLNKETPSNLYGVGIK
jgi:hypothetical protein